MVERAVVGVVVGARVVAANVAGLPFEESAERTLLTADRVERTAEVLTASPPPVAVGSIAHSTARASRPPTAPVVTSRPRPIVSGGSVRRQVASPTSDGCRHCRSCWGRGASG